MIVVNKMGKTIKEKVLLIIIFSILRISKEGGGVKKELVIVRRVAARKDAAFVDSGEAVK